MRQFAASTVTRGGALAGGAAGGAARPGSLMEGRIRIATLFTELLFGGDENRVLHFAGALDPSRFDHCVVTLTPSDRAQDHKGGPMAARYHAAGIRTFSLGVKRRADLPPLPQPVAAARDVRRLVDSATRL